MKRLSLLFSVSWFLAAAALASENTLSKGSSLHVDDDSDILVSPNKTFTCGFSKVGDNAFVFSIWFSNSARTIAWAANRDRPVNGQGSRTTFGKDGGMTLTDIDNTIAWSTNTSLTEADRAELLDTGNLVVKNPNGNILWQSFDSPTDTLLPAQPITKNIKLVYA